jgi:hypothetical protein
MPVFPKTLQYEIIETDFRAPRISGVCPESPPLDQIVDLDHPLAKLGRAIDWRFLEARFGAVYSGRPPPSADAADGGAFDPQAHAQSLRRGSVRTLD